MMRGGAGYGWTSLSKATEKFKCMQILAPYISLRYNKPKIILMVIDINPWAFTRH